MKKAKLVQVVFTTRVIVDENENEEYDYGKMVGDVSNNLMKRIENCEVEENIETIFDDEECPYNEEFDMEDWEVANLCNNKSLAEIEGMESEFLKRESLRRLYSRNISAFGLFRPNLPFDVQSEPHDPHSAFFPIINEINEHKEEGIIFFVIDGEFHEFDDIPTEDLIWVANQLELS